jgi:hypothetical protein
MCLFASLLVASGRPALASSIRPLRGRAALEYGRVQFDRARNSKRVADLLEACVANSGRPA